MSDIYVIQPEPNYRPPTNADGDVKSLAYRLVAVEDQIDAQNKLKALIYAEAKLAGVDIGALKSTVRVVRYLPQSSQDTLPGLTAKVKEYLDAVTKKPGSLV
jgi:uncharacterized protein (UPF0335 family)